MRPLRNRIRAQAVRKDPHQEPELWPLELYSPWGEPALVASMPAAVSSSKQGRENACVWQAAKESLALFLAEHFLEKKLTDFAISSDRLGKPRIWLGAAPGPALSFSWGAGRLWAAVGRPGNGLGLDAAAPREFNEAYPNKRVFLETEWQTAVGLAAGDAAEAAAMLWSVKEAVVKAKGCGFHFLSPRQVKLEFAALGEDCYLWRGYPENPSQDENLPGVWEPCLAVSVRSQECWLSMAWSR